jgi:hypothetical protein
MFGAFYYPFFLEIFCLSDNVEKSLVLSATAFQFFSDVGGRRQRKKSLAM